MNWRTIASQRGFTLIETLTVLVIMLILASMVYPGYARFVVKARRAEAQAALLELMQKQERYFTQHNRYLAFSAISSDEDAKRFKWYSGTRAASSGYELRGEACPADKIEYCILLTALPGTAMVDRNFKDPECGALTLSSRGERRAEGQAARCWP
jgi:type IV pilus assembly protein PilE